MSAKQIDFLLAGYHHPTTDAVLSGGKVYTYLDGTPELRQIRTVIEPELPSLAVALGLIGLNKDKQND